MRKRAEFYSAIDKEYAVGKFVGRVILYFRVAEPLLEILQRDDLAVAFLLFFSGLFTPCGRISADFLQVQDAYLQSETAAKGITDIVDLTPIRDMYSGGFYPFATPEEHWAYWSRYIYINRYMDVPKPVYDDLLKLVADKDYFVITTNIDHCFQKAGFDKKRLFYTQGDYGLFQCSEPCCQETFENEAMIRKMVKRQENMKIPTELLPACPYCGKPLTMNLRADDKFVEDEGWHRAAERYENFLRTRNGQKVLFLELGVGYNTPVIIKYPFWQMTARNPDATYVCINADLGTVLHNTTFNGNTSKSAPQ